MSDAGSMPRTMERRGSNHFRPKTPTSAVDDPMVRNKTGADDALDAANEELKAQLARLKHQYRLIELQTQIGLKRMGYASKQSGLSRRMGGSQKRNRAKRSGPSPSRTKAQLGGATPSRGKKAAVKGPNDGLLGDVDMTAFAGGNESQLGGGGSPLKSANTFGTGVTFTSPVGGSTSGGFPSQTQTTPFEDAGQKANPLYVETDSEAENDEDYGFKAGDFEGEDVGLAATKIQAAFRGQQVRKSLASTPRASAVGASTLADRMAALDDQAQSSSAVVTSKPAVLDRAASATTGNKFALKAPLRNAGAEIAPTVPVVAGAPSPEAAAAAAADESRRVMRHKVSLKFSNDSPVKVGSQPGPAVIPEASKLNESMTAALPVLPPVDNSYASEKERIAALVNVDESKARVEDMSFNFSFGADPDDGNDAGANNEFANVIDAAQEAPTKRPSLTLDNGDDDDDEDTKFGFDDADFDSEFSDGD